MSVIERIFLLLVVVVFSSNALSGDKMHKGEVKPFVLYGLVSRGSSELLTQTMSQLNDGKVVLISTFKMIGKHKSRSFVMDSGVRFEYEIPSIYRCREVLSEKYLRSTSKALDSRCWQL